MIDLSNLKAPGWSRVVAELCQPAADDRAYLERLLRIIGQVSAARQATLLVPQTTDAGASAALPISVWPVPGATGGSGAAGGGGEGEVAAAEKVTIDFDREVRQAGLAVIESSQSRAWGLDNVDGLYDGSGGGRGLLLGIPVGDGGGRCAAAIVLNVESRNRAAVQSALAMAEVLAGYVQGHASRRELQRSQSSAMGLELATRLISAINGQVTFKGAALQLVNDLVRQLGADRAAMGWLVGNSVKVLAISDAEEFNPRTELVRKLSVAMDECLDQEQAVLFPPPEGSQDVALAQAITSGHRELCAGSADLVAVSVPLRRGEVTVGVLTVELRTPGEARAKGRQAIDVRGVEVLQTAADLVGPVLATRRSDDRVWPLRTYDSALRAGAWAVGTKHTAWKVAGLAVIAAVTFCAMFKIEHRVGSQARLEALEKRTIAAPVEGIVLSLGPGVEPGATVKAGDVLLELDTRELRLTLASAQARRVQGERQLANAMKESKAGEAQMAQAAIDKARAEERLAERRIELSRVVAPIDGVILSGELKDKVGVAVKPGDALLQVGSLQGLTVVARVDERDVGLIEAGGGGFVRTRSRPDLDVPVKIRSIVPLATAHEGKNEFEVRAVPSDVPVWMRPGMEGVARLDAGRRTLLWIGTRRIVDTVRLWLW